MNTGHSQTTNSPAREDVKKDIPVLKKRKQDRTQTFKTFRMIFTTKIEISS